MKAILIASLLLFQVQATEDPIDQQPNGRIVPIPGICFPLQQTHEFLTKTYGEHIVSIMTTENGSRVALYYSNDVETATVVIFKKSGEGCVVASGKIDYIELYREKKDQSL